MAAPLEWSRNPDMWRLHGKRLSLRAAIEASRSLRLAVRQERLDREHTRLCSRWQALVNEGQIAQRMNDPAVMRRVANRIAAFYQQFGAFERDVDALLLETDGLDLRAG